MTAREEMLALAENVERCALDALSAAGEDEWYSAISAAVRGLDEIASFLRARAAAGDAS
jgi:hypothetical protein